MINEQAGDFGSEIIDPYQENNQPKKMDILFYEAIRKVKSNLSVNSAFHLLKAVLFIVFIPIDYTIVGGSHDGRILAAMILALAASFFQFVGMLLYRLIPMRNNQMLVNLSALMGHGTQQQLSKDYKNIKQCVSQTMYNQQNLTLNSSQGLTDELRKKYKMIMASNLRQTIVNCHPCLNKIDNLAEFLGFVSFIYAIIALIVGNYNTSELALLIVFIVLEGLSKIIVILVFAVIALFPVLCILFCCCLCFCGKGEDGQARLPEAEKATQKMITEADGTCSICYQNFIVGDNVVRLKCSPKHMFHPLCISGWAKLKPTCPICRASITNQIEAIPEAQNSN